MIYDIGNDQLDVRTRMGMIDTFTVKSYTVMLDSVPTSGVPTSGWKLLNNPAVVVGNYHDEEFGTISASSFFRVLLPSRVTSSTGTRSYAINENAVFDSIRLYMVYNKYYEGDTTLPFTINLHRLTDRLKPNTDGYFYNNDSIPAMPEIIGSKIFRPSPNSGDTVWITLEVDLGADLFEKMKDNQTVVIENDYFQDFFKGFMVRYDESNNAIIGFNFPTGESGQNLPAMRIYYHYFEYTTVKRFIDFRAQAVDDVNPLDPIQLQFNRFTLRNRRINFPLDQGTKLSVSHTGNRSYVHAGLGIVTRLEIPYLKNLYYISDDVRILDARLELEPVSGTYDEKTLPREISLVTTDDINRWGTLLWDKSGSNYNAALTIDMLYQEDTRYTFDVTNFLVSRLELQSNMIPAVLLTVSAEDLYKTGKRLRLGSQQHKENKVRLRVYYMNVN